jgi:hypothetical protein
MHGGSYSPSLERRLSLTLMPGDQQHHPVAGGNCAIQPFVDRLPGSVEAVAMEVEDHFRFDPPRPKSAIPAAIERRILQAFAWQRNGLSRSLLGRPPFWPACDGRLRR